MRLAAGLLALGRLLLLPELSQGLVVLVPPRRAGSAPELGLVALDAGAVELTPRKTILISVDDDLGVQSALPERHLLLEVFLGLVVLVGTLEPGDVTLVFERGLARCLVRSCLHEQVVAVLDPGEAEVEVAEMVPDLLLDGVAQVLLGRLQ